MREGGREREKEGEREREREREKERERERIVQILNIKDQSRDCVD